jgi:hypothetical protein
MPMVIGLTVIGLSETPREMARKTQTANNAAIRSRKSIEASFVRAGCNYCYRLPEVEHARPAAENSGRKLFRL